MSEARRPAIHSLPLKSAIWVVVYLLSLVVASQAQNVAGGADILTAEERAWLTAHPVLYLAPDPAYEPVEFFDEQGVYRGISADYLALIEQRLGFRFQVVNRRQVQAVWDAGQVVVDAMPTCVATPERERTWTFTTPYLEFPTYLITRKSVTEALTIAQLKGSRVAVVTDYGVREYLATKYPEIILDPVPDTRTGLQKVSFGLVDAFVSDLPVATYWMEREGITNLKVSGEVSYVYQLGFGLPSDRRPLDHILEKGLALITPEERAAIYHKWVKLPVEPSQFSRRMGLASVGVFGIVGIGLLGVLWWNRSLTAQVKERTAALQQELQERKQAEQELRASEERFATIFRASPSPLGIARSSDGEILDVNDRWVQLSGYGKEELMGQLALKTDLWKLSSRREELIELIQNRQSIRDFEATYHTKTGETRTALLSVEGIALGAEECNLWTVQDITERKLMEEALRQSEAMFRSMAESTSAWVFIARGTTICYFNAAVEAGTGYKYEEFIGKEVWAIIHPDDHEFILKRIQTRQQNSLLPLHYEARIITKAGEVRWVQITTTSIEYQSTPAQLSTAFDITERKNAEEQLKISEQRLHQLAGYLQTAREQERTSIAREIHDELGQAMTAIKMDLSWLTKRVPAEQTLLQERLRGMVDLADDTIQTVRRLATQLRPGMLDDLGLLAALEWQAHEFQTRTGVTCEFVAETEIADLAPESATALFRIGQEALTNVARHAHATQVNIRLWEEGKHLLLEIKDNGRGITTHETTHARSFGLLGMHERTFLLGGEFHLSGSPNKGTTVTARIPLSQAKAKGGTL